MCKACVGGWTDVNKESGSCICTAGLDKVCGSCNPVWKTNIPGTYDAQYNAWVAANPQPAPLQLPAPPQIGAASFACVQCTQCQDFSGMNNTGVGTVNITDISQVQTCVGNMQSSLDAANAAAQQAAQAAATQSAIDALAAKQAAAIAALAAQQAAALAAQQKTQQAALAAQAAQIDALKKAQAAAVAQQAAIAANAAAQAAHDKAQAEADAAGTEQRDILLFMIIFLVVIFAGVLYAVLMADGAKSGGSNTLVHIWSSSKK